MGCLAVPSARTLRALDPSTIGAPLLNAMSAFVDDAFNLSLSVYDDGSEIVGQMRGYSYACAGFVEESPF